jgi:hypothetical protein
MSTVITIYRQTYRHRDREFTVWSFLSSSDPESSSLLFAFQSEGETVEGLADRAEAIRQARQRIDKRPALAGRGNAGNGGAADDPRASAAAGGASARIGA